MRTRPCTLPLFPVQDQREPHKPAKRLGDYKGKVIDNPNNLPRCVNEKASSDSLGEEKVLGAGGGAAMTSAVQCAASSGEEGCDAAPARVCLRASDLCQSVTNRDDIKSANVSNLLGSSQVKDSENDLVANRTNEVLSKIRNVDDERKTKIANVCLKTLKDLTNSNSKKQQATAAAATASPEHSEAEKVPHLAAGGRAGESVAVPHDPDSVAARRAAERHCHPRPLSSPAVVAARHEAMRHGREHQRDLLKPGKGDQFRATSVLEERGSKIDERGLWDDDRKKDKSGESYNNISDAGRLNAQKLAAGYSRVNNEKNLGGSRSVKPELTADAERIIEHTRKLSSANVNNINLTNSHQDGKGDWYSTTST